MTETSSTFASAVSFKSPERIEPVDSAGVPYNITGGDSILMLTE